MTSAHVRPTYRLLTLNIGGPSLDRAGRLTDYLLEQDLDVIVLTETRPNLGTESLVDALCASGYEVSWPRPPTSGERGVALLSRSGVPPSGRGRSIHFGHRLVVQAVTLGSPLTFVGAYVPSRDATSQKLARKQHFLTQLLDVLSDPRHLERTILMGDLNIVGRDHRPRYSAFRSWEYEALERIAQLGFVDVFRITPSGRAGSQLDRPNRRWLPV